MLAVPRIQLPDANVSMRTMYEEADRIALKYIQDGVCVRACVRACVWCSVVWCGVVWCGVVWCSVVVCVCVHACMCASVFLCVCVYGVVCVSVYLSVCDQHTCILSKSAVHASVLVMTDIDLPEWCL